jgi:hypothetical protein
MVMKRAAFVIGLGVVGVAALWSRVSAFDPQPDPPSFGLVSITPDQKIRLNVVCSEHGVGALPPGPCRGALMFHDAAGEVLVEDTVQLGPGQTASLEYEIGVRTGALERVGIVPCVIPGPDSGRLLPTTEVADRETGRTALFITPITPRLSFVDAEPGKR